MPEQLNNQNKPKSPTEAVGVYGEPTLLDYEFAQGMLAREWMKQQSEAIQLGYSAVIAAYEDAQKPLPKIARPPKIARLPEAEASAALLSSQTETIEMSEFPADDSDTIQFSIPAEQVHDNEGAVVDEGAPVENTVSYHEIASDEQSHDAIDEHMPATETAFDKFSRLEIHRQQELQKLMDRIGIMIGEIQTGRMSDDTTLRLGSLVYLTQELRGLELQRHGIVSDILHQSGSNATAQVGELLLDRQQRYDNKTVDERLMTTKAAIQEAQQAAVYGNARGAVTELETARIIIDGMIDRGESDSTKLSQFLKELLDNIAE